MTKPKTTRKQTRIPRKKGYYWFRCRDKQEWRIAYATFYYGEFQLWDREFDYDKEGVDGWQFVGPIKPPPTKKKGKAK